MNNIGFYEGSKGSLGEGEDVLHEELPGLPSGQHCSPRHRRGRGAHPLSLVSFSKLGVPFYIFLRVLKPYRE